MFYAINIAICFMLSILRYVFTQLISWGIATLLWWKGLCIPVTLGAVWSGATPPARLYKSKLVPGCQTDKSPFSIRMVPVHQISSLHMTFLVLHWENLVPGRFFGITSVEVSNELKE